TARPRITTGRGHSTSRRSGLIAAFGAPPSAEPQSATQKGADTGGAASPPGGSGAPAARRDDFRGRAVDRPDLARIARSHCRAGPRFAGAVDRDVPTRVPAALERRAACDD